jgi:sodium pump decarboxylase gamma subunit
MNATTLSIPSALGTSVLGFAIVFFVLIVLMCVIKIIRGVLEQMAAPAAAAPAAAVAAPAAKANANMVPAKGSLGDIKLFEVEDKTAAMLMAIVADKIGAPLNELRFLSIREKK